MNQSMVLDAIAPLTATIVLPLAPVPFKLRTEKPRRSAVADLRLEMPLSFTGIGRIAFVFTMPGHIGWGIGFIPFFAGIGFLVTWKIGRTSQNPRNDD